LQFSRDRLWQDFRISMPPSAGLPRFDHRADVTGVGLVALGLVLGRPLNATEFPNQLSTLLNEARERTALGEEQPLSQPLRDWLARALQLDVRRAFASAPEALTALEEIVADDSMYVAAPVALETFLSRYIAALLELPTADPIPAPAPSVFVPPAPVATHPASPITPPGGPTPAVATTASKVAASAPPPPPVVTTAPAGPSFTRPVSAPLPEPLRNPPAAAKHDTWADAPVSAAAPGIPARDITELISAADLKVRPEPTSAPQPLFNPDAPFNVSAPAAQAKSTPTVKRQRPKLPKLSKKAVLLAAAIILIASAGVFASRFMTGGGGPGPSSGTLAVQSNPAGVQVFVDGVDRGQTPARLSVTPGAHILELRGRGVPRVIPLNVTAGSEVSQYLEFANTPEVGSLRVESQPAGAKVLVDGADRGTAPLTVTDLLPGDHEVVLQTSLGSARHVVSVQAGGTASLVAPVSSAATATGPVSGWLTVKSPFSLEIREGGQLLGTTDADRLMLAAGRHDIQLVSETMDYRVTRVVTVMPGKVANLTIELPNGVVHLNATPWAEVWVDGQRVGETPIGNLSVPIGPHEIVFRHPQFGEKRHAISVSLSGPTRVSVDMK